MCNCKKRINGMARRKGKFADVIPAALAGGAGFVAGNMLTSKVAFLQENALVGAAAKVGIGAFLASSSKNNLVQGAGLGMATSGVVQGIAHVMPAEAGVSGLPTGSAGFNYIAASRRNSRRHRSYVPMAKVN